MVVGSRSGPPPPEPGSARGATALTASMAVPRHLPPGQARLHRAERPRRRGPRGSSEFWQPPPASGGPLSARRLGPLYGPASRNEPKPYATVVLQYTNHGLTPRATARVALGVYPPLPPAAVSRERGLDHDLERPGWECPVCSKICRYMLSSMEKKMMHYLGLVLWTGGR
jgi:hypothetical protein